LILRCFKFIVSNFVKMARKDILWKGMLEEVFDDFLRFFFPDADSLYDLDRGFVFLDKELGEMYPEPDKEMDTRYVDKLVKVYRKDGGESWLLLHVEVQGYHDPLFPQRMFTYYYKVLDKHKRPIVAVALLTGPDGMNLPDTYEVKEQGTELRYRYNTLRIQDFKDEELKVSKNRFALVLLAAKTVFLQGKAEALMSYKEQVLNVLAEWGIMVDKKIDYILSFLTNYVPFDKPEENRTFMEKIDLKTGKRNTMGIIEQVQEIRYREAKEQGVLEGRAEGRTEGVLEGIAEGLQKAKRELVENALKQTEFSDDKIASLANVTVEFVNKIKKDLKIK
jgi:predicted transposase YdaD